MFRNPQDAPKVKITMNCLIAKFFIKYKGKNFKVIIDKEDLEKVSKHSWSISRGSNDNYLRAETRINKKLVRLHRFILNINDSKVHIDHINGNPFDNRKINLRLCTHKQNMKNRRKISNNSTNYINVYELRNGKFRAKYSDNNKTHRVPGYYNTAKEAAIARDDYLFEKFGEFIMLNFPERKNVS